MSLARRPDLPLFIVTTVLGQLKYIHAFLEQNHTKEISDSVRQSLKNRLQNIQHVELKETDREIIQRAINCYESFSRAYDPSI
jgi:hypothetical protein